MRGLYLVALTIGISSAHAAEPEKPPVPLPAKLVESWNKAGANEGWMGLDRAGGFSTDEKGQPGQIPAFSLTELKKGVVGRLPVPERPFGLSLHMAKVTGADLRGETRESGQLRRAREFDEPCEGGVTKFRCDGGILRPGRETGRGSRRSARRSESARLADTIQRGGSIQTWREQSQKPLHAGDGGGALLDVCACLGGLCMRLDLELVAPGAVL